MQTQFNKEIYDFKENFWKGLTRRQAVWGGIALVGGVLIMVYVGFYLKQDWGQIVGAIVTLVCGFIGFFTMDGMPGEIVVYLIYRKMKTPRVLVAEDEEELPVMYHRGGYHQDYYNEIAEETAKEDEDSSEESSEINNDTEIIDNNDISEV